MYDYKLNNIEINKDTDYFMQLEQFNNNNKNKLDAHNDKQKPRVAV